MCPSGLLLQVLMMEEASLKTVSLSILAHDVIKIYFILIILIYIYIMYINIYIYIDIYVGETLLKIKHKVKWVVKFVET